MISAKALTVPGAALAIFAVTASGADAQRPDTRAFHCQAIHASLAKYGYLIMSYSNTQYARFVDGHGDCGDSQSVRHVIVPALDTPRCSLKICEERTRPGG